MATEEVVYTALKYNIVTSSQGTRRYFNNANQLHREDGPAIISPNGTKLWYQNGSLHRTDGPAIIWCDGAKEWWIDGEEYTQQEYSTQLKAQGFTL